MSIVPVDFVAQSICDLSTKSVRGEGQIYHLHHPKEVSFVDLVKTYNQRNGDAQGKTIDLLPFTEFIRRLKQSIQQGLAIPIEYQYSDLLQLSDDELDSQLAQRQVSMDDSEPFVLEVSHTSEHLQQQGLSFPTMDDEWLLKYFER